MGVAKPILIGIFFFFIFSCAIRVPIKYISSDEIKIEKDYNQNIRSRILGELEKITLNTGGNPSSDECKNVFIEWFNQQYITGFIPKRTIPAREYALGNPRFYQCPPIIMDQEVDNVFKTLQGRVGSSVNYIFDLSTAKMRLPSSKCLDKFIDPSQERLNITDIIVNIEKNSLNYISPEIRVYYTTQRVSEADVKRNSEKKFLEDNKIKLLATIPKVPPKSEGEIKAILVSKKELDEAKKVLTPLNSQLIFYQDLLEPYETNIENKTYYVTPLGELFMSIQTHFDILVTINDASCFWNEKKEELRKKDEERKKEYDEKHK
jgi:hypothetical protein